MDWGNVAEVAQLGRRCDWLPDDQIRKLKSSFESVHFFFFFFFLLIVQRFFFLQLFCDL